MMEFTVSVSGQRREMSGGGWLRGGGGASALDGFNGQRIMPIYACTVIKKNERMERAKAWCRGRYRVISGIKKSNKNPGRVKIQL